MTTTTQVANSTSTNLSSINNIKFCTSALTASRPYGWEKSALYIDKVIEAKRRGLTPESCAALLGRTTTQVDNTSTNTILRTVPKDITDMMATEYFNKNKFKVVAVASDSDYGYAWGEVNNYYILENAIRNAIDQCNESKAEYNVGAPCKVRYLGNVDVGGLSDNELDIAIADYKKYPDLYGGSTIVAWLDVKNVATKLAYVGPYKSWTDKGLCSVSITPEEKPLDWVDKREWNERVKEAKLRHLTPLSCAVLLGRNITTQVVETVTPQPTYDKAEVLNIQSLLTELGYNPGPADGQMGSRTKNAIVAFQTSQNGFAGTDGEIDNRLVAALNVAV